MTVWTTEGSDGTSWNGGPAEGYEPSVLAPSGNGNNTGSGYALVSVAITPEQYGAVGDGITDDQVALQAMLDACSTNNIARLTPGKTYAHSGILKVKSNTHWEGYGALLIATGITSGSISVWDESGGTTTNVVLRGIKHRLYRPDGTTREHPGAYDYNTSAFYFQNVNTLLVEDCVGERTIKVFFFLANVVNFRFYSCSGSDSLADGFHMTDGCKNGFVRDWTAHRAGDDGIAVVSYLSQSVICSNIEIVRPHILDQFNSGRGVTVVGGKTIVIRDIYVYRSFGAAIYIGAERGDFNTHGVEDVRVLGGRVAQSNYRRGSNESLTPDHGAILILCQGATVVKDVDIMGIEVQDTHESRAVLNDRLSSGGAFQNCRVHNITITGDRGYLFNSQAGASEVNNGVGNGITYTWQWGGDWEQTLYEQFRFLTADVVSTTSTFETGTYTQEIKWEEVNQPGIYEYDITGVYYTDDPLNAIGFFFGMNGNVDHQQHVLEISTSLDVRETTTKELTNHITFGTKSSGATRLPFRLFGYVSWTVLMNNVLHLGIVSKNPGSPVTLARGARGTLRRIK